MRATVMYAAGDVRIENVPDATIIEATDAVVRVTSACICGSDLWPYKTMEPSGSGRMMGHEAIGVVAREAVKKGAGAGRSAAEALVGQVAGDDAVRQGHRLILDEQPASLQGDA
jgi:threonine dehydrogenase-like Zn-dependent dehydrogenase